MEKNQDDWEPLKNSCVCSIHYLEISILSPYFTDGEKQRQMCMKNSRVCSNRFLEISILSRYLTDGFKYLFCFNI